MFQYITFIVLLSLHNFLMLLETSNHLEKIVILSLFSSKHRATSTCFSQPIDCYYQYPIHNAICLVFQMTR